MKVLLVEDHPLALKIARFMLNKLNCEVEDASTGEEALNKALNNHYDLILMDIGLPDWDGMIVTQKLRDEGVTVPIYALTAHNDEGHKIEAHHAGMNGFLIKPLEDLHVQRVIARTQSAMQIPRALP